MMRSDKIMQLKQNASLLNITNESKKKANSRAAMRSPKTGSPRRLRKPESPKMSKTDSLNQPEIMNRGNMSRGKARPTSSAGKGPVSKTKTLNSSSKP